MNVLVLHGHTMNGRVMGAALAPLAIKLGTRATLRCVDAPHVCAPESVERLYSQWQRPRLPPPHLTWLDATDDGRVYHGWEETLDVIRAELTAWTPRVVLGFSLGAVVATGIAALASRGMLPKVDGVVLIAGRTPRSDALAPLLAPPLTLPSLHVWGEGDTFMRDVARQLVEVFDPADRSVVTWPGAHEVPSDGAPLDAIANFILART